ncbi:hypothetical protein BH09ACT10_BH09ACT10_05980 [soil metagenome]
MGAELTLGAEEELHLIDLESWRLSARAPQVLARLPRENYSAELQRTTVETNTDVVSTLAELRAELLRLRKGVIDAAAPEGVGIAAVGSAPRSDFADFELTTSGRYGKMQEQYRLLVDEQLICGTQIHVGVADRDMAVAIAQRVARDLPPLLALSASSPFWSGHDTGYASIRTLIWQRWPSAGATGPLASAQEYDDLLADLIQTGVIADDGMAYFDVRPSSHAPTLELRICDACPLVDDAVLIAGLFRASVRSAEIEIESGAPHHPVAAPIHRAAIWQAARGGLSGSLLDDSAHPRPIPAARAIRNLVHRLRPQLEELGDYEVVRDLAETVLARGNSTDRQRAAFAERGRLEDVVRQVVRETHGPAEGLASATPSLSTYRARAGDEAVGPGAEPRAAYREIVEAFRALGDETIQERQSMRDEWIANSGLTFGVGGAHKSLHVDLMPRIINPHEWAALKVGLEQRARAIESFLQDIYTEQRVVADGVLPLEAVRDSPGWRNEAARLPAGTVRAPIMGFDVVRNEFGAWRVLEDNVRVPSGAGYAVAVRELLDGVIPEIPRPTGLLDPHAHFAAIRETLLAHAGPDAVGAIFTSGRKNSAWYEHERIARESGFLLVEADDLAVTDGRVIHRDSDTVVAVLYLRVDAHLIDVESSDGLPLGAEILRVAEQGNVFLANAPGNGVADDKALYCYVPELIAYYLQERPAIESVPTYRTSNEVERQIVLERVGELVTKPVDGEGGAGVMIGPAADASEVAERRAAIAARPSDWIAQELVALSSHPTFSGSRLEPRHVDLRVFVYVIGTGPGDVRLADLALTRVAPEGNMVVNSSRGGGAKDTWIISGEG